MKLYDFLPHTADVKIMARLLEKVAGLDAQRALSIAYCIIDWRDADSFFQQIDVHAHLLNA